MPRQKQKSDLQPQHVFDNWPWDLNPQTDAAIYVGYGTLSFFPHLDTNDVSWDPEAYGMDKQLLFNLHLFHNSWYADTALWGGFTRWWPHSTQSIPLFARIFDDATPIECFSKHVFRSPITWPDSWVSISDHGAYTEVLVMPSERADASKGIATPVSEKKLRWVKIGSSTKSGTQNRTPRTSSPLISTQSSFFVNLYRDVTGPRIASAVNWKAWNGTWMSRKQQRDYTSHVWRQYIFYTDGVAHEN